MNDEIEHSEYHKKFSEDIPLIVDIPNYVSSKESPHLEYELMELTSKHEITEKKGDSDTCQSSPRKQVVVRLEPSLGEKLAKKRATADELEDKLQALRFDFKNKFQSVDHMKKELNNLEAHLLQSVQKVEGYMRQIYSLKREADDLFEKLKSTSIQLALDFSILTREYDYVHSKIGATVAILKRYRPAQSCLRKAISDLDEYSTVKDLVEYYLVLKLLGNDLLEEDKKRLEEARQYESEQKRIGERARNLPLDILAKEETLYKIKSELKEMRLKNIELEQQVSNLLSSKAKEDMTWQDIKRWISNTYKNVCEIIPPDESEPKGGIVNQLQKLHDFIVIGSKVVERLRSVETLD